MRLYAVSFVLAVLFLLPSMAELFNFSIDSIGGLLSIPATGLDYMLTFFHELGHAGTAWLFGYPALPSFDFEYGGGMTYSFDRVWLLQGVVIAALAAGIGWLFRIGERVLAFTAVFVFAGFLALSFTQGHEALIKFMGHGAEIGVAAFCLLRAILNRTVGGAVERYLNMTFGFFTIGRDGLLLGGLMFSDIARDAYAHQKGGEFFGDFDQVADALMITTQQAAGLGLVYMVLVLVYIAVTARRVKACSPAC